MFPVFFQSKKQYHTQYAAGNDFSYCHGKEGQPKRADSISIQQYKGNNNGVCNNGGNWRQPFKAAEFIGKDCANQSGKAAKYNIGQCTSGQDVRQNAADKKAGYGSGGKIRQDSKRLGKSHLNGIVSQTQCICKEGEDNVDGSNHGCLNQRQCAARM